MDSDKFDKLAKALTNDTTRRGVLGGLAGILASVVGAGSTEARKRAQGGKGAKQKKCRNEGHPCEGNQECCAGLVCRVTGPGNAERCAKPICPKPKCNCSTCTCKHHGDCATGCCKGGYCCPKGKCEPKPPCPTTCPKDYCGALKVPKGCPPVDCPCPKGYECKDHKCVPCECKDKDGNCIVCPPKPVYCDGNDSPKQCPKNMKVQYTCKDTSTCPAEYHGVVEVECVDDKTPVCVYKQNQPKEGQPIPGCYPVKCSNNAS